MAAWTDGQAATRVLGQSDFTSNSGGRTASRFNQPYAICSDPASGKVFVVDFLGNRILRFTSAQATTTGGSAEAVLGQVNFASNNIGTTATTLNRPVACAIDSAGHLFVAEADNQRVLRYDNAAAKATGASADGVLGQADFTSSASGTTASSFGGSLTGIALGPNGSLYVADATNQRVLRFDNAAAKANGAAADGVLGAADFTTAGAGGMTATTLGNPQGLAVDASGNLFVSDLDNKRILRFNSAATKGNGAAADGVLGAADLTAPGSGVVSQSRFAGVQGLAVLADGALYAASRSQNRVLVFNSPATKADGANADSVLGQTTFTSSIAAFPPTATELRSPYGIGATQDGYLMIADTFNARVVGHFSAALLDTTAPVFASATVNGATLVMTYSESNVLDAVNIPAVGTFTVKVGGTAQAAPTAVTVSAVAKTVTLTLAAAVANGNVVTVSYTDPTAGNDANAIQDARGNDAATISDQAVTNNTAAPAAPVAPAVDPGPPPNPFNPAGNATQAAAPAGTSRTTASSSLVTNLANLGNKVGVSDNGVVVIQDTPKEPVKLKDDAPDNVLFSLPATKLIPILVGGKQIDVVSDNEPVKGSDGKNAATVLSTKTFTNDQGQNVQALNLLSGEAKLTANQDQQTLGGFTLSQGATQREVTTTGGAAGSSVGFHKNPADYSGAVSAESGDVSVVVKPSAASAKSAAFAATAATITLTLKEGEVARFNSAGDLSGVYVGSLSGTAGKTGDPVAVTVPANVIAYPSTGIAKLDGNKIGRLGNNLLPAFAEVAIGSGTGTGTGTGGNTMTQDSSTGATRLVTASRSYYGLPLLPVTVDAAVADGIVRNSDGTVSWTQKGISVRFAPSVGDIAQFAADAQAGYALSTQVRGDGAMKLVGSGILYLGRPRFETETGLTGGSGFRWNAQFNRLTYTDAGGKTQVFDPTLMDAGQVAQTVAGMGAGWAMHSETDGTLTVTGPGGALYKLLPDYAAKLSTIGKALNSAWLAQDGKIYYLYNTAIVPTLQGITLQ